MNPSNSTSKILSRRDLAFVLYEWLGVEDLLLRERHAEHSRETFDAVIDAGERLATDVFSHQQGVRSCQLITFTTYREACAEDA